MFDELADLRRLSSESILIWLIIGPYVEFLNFRLILSESHYLFFRVNILERMPLSWLSHSLLTKCHNFKWRQNVWTHVSKNPLKICKCECCCSSFLHRDGCCSDIPKLSMSKLRNCCLLLWPWRVWSKQFVAKYNVETKDQSLKSSLITRIWSMIFWNWENFSEHMAIWLKYLCFMTIEYRNFYLL